MAQSPQHDDSKTQGNPATFILRFSKEQTAALKGRPRGELARPGWPDSAWLPGVKQASLIEREAKACSDTEGQEKLW